MTFTRLFFDLDDTLYTRNNGLWEAIRARMSTFMIERMGMPEDEVIRLRRDYFERYGTTLRGLQIHHQVNPDDYLAFVHDLPLRQYLRPDLKLKTLLQSLALPKYIFTNADADHAVRVLNILGVSDQFSGIIDVRAMEYYCKPEPEAYHIALNLAGESEGHNCILIDDSLRNLVGAKMAGFTTILVGSKPTNNHVDYAIENITDLHSLYPALQDSLPLGSNPVN